MYSLHLTQILFNIDLKDYVKPKKKKDDEEDPNKEKKRANILDRANPFRRPFEKE